MPAATNSHSYALYLEYPKYYNAPDIVKTFYRLDNDLREVGTFRECQEVMNRLDKSYYIKMEIVRLTPATKAAH